MREVASAMTIYADPLSDNISIADSVMEGGRIMLKLRQKPTLQLI
jgi:hypothetical protein